MQELLVRQNDRGFFYTDLLSGPHGRDRTRLWLDKSLVRPTAGGHFYTTLPTRGRVVKTEKGSLVLRPGDSTVFFVTVESGYRGRAEVSVAGGNVIATGHWLASDLGALGETAWALVESAAPYVEVRGTRTGRRVTDPKVHQRWWADGRVEEVVDDVAHLLEEE